MVRLLLRCTVRFLPLVLGAFLGLQAQAPRRLVVGSALNSPPYEYLDERGQPAGYVNDLIRAVARSQGMEVEIRSMPFGRVVEAFERGEVDVVSGMVFSESRAGSMAFSAPHSVFSYVLVTRKGEGRIRSERDCAGRDLMVLERSIMPEHLASQGIAFRTMPTNEASVLALASGKGDAAILPKFTFLYLVKHRGIRNLQIIPGEIFPTRRCFAVHRGDEKLLAALNEGLFLVKQNGTMDRIHQRNLGDLEAAELPVSTALRRAFWTLGPAVLGLGLLGLLGWTLSLRRLVRARTAELDVRNRDLSEHNRELETLDQMVGAINREMELQPLMERLLAGYCAQFPGAGNGVLLLKDEADGGFRVRIHLGAWPEGVERVLLTEEEALARYTEGAERLGDGLYRVRRPGRAAGGEPPAGMSVPAALLAMSLVFGGRIEGFLVLVSFSDQDAFDAAEAQKLARLREHAIAALAKARTLDRLVCALSELRRANELKNQFLGIAAHDLRNPLNGIVLAAQLLEGEEDLEQVGQIARKIHSEGMEMSALIGRFLDIARIDSGELKAEPEVCDLAALMRRVADRHAARAGEKGIAFEFRLPEGGAEAFADPRLVKEVLDNLLSNAVKFSPPGTTVTLRVEAGVHAVASVEDQGPGLTDLDRASLFGRFSRLSAQPTGGEKSTGLGLNIAKHMVDANGGRIWVESEPGRGAAFRVELPLPQGRP